MKPQSFHDEDSFKEIPIISKKYLKEYLWKYVFRMFRSTAFHSNFLLRIILAGGLELDDF